jgi:hypothetical protein
MPRVPRAAKIAALFRETVMARTGYYANRDALVTGAPFGIA